MAERKIERPGFLPKKETRVQPAEDFSLFRETVKGLPEAAGEVSQGIARGVASSLALPVAGYMSAAKSIKEGSPTFVQPKFTPTQSKISELTFGEKDFTPTSEFVELQDVFRNKYNPNAGKFTAATVPVGAAAATLDIPTGGAFSRVAKVISSQLSKYRSAAKSADKVEDALSALKNGGVSDDIINTFDLDNRIVRANTDAEVDQIFKEAATSESVFRETGKVPASKSIARPQPVETPQTRPQIRESASQPTTPRFERQDVDINPAATRQSVRQQTLDQADEARFVRDEVLPDPQITPVLRQVSDVAEVTPEGSISTTQLSRRAGNSLENRPTGIRQPALDAQTPAIRAGEADRAVEVRLLEDGSIDIVDGRHFLEVARKEGIPNVDIVDVTDQYFPQGIPNPRQAREAATTPRNTEEVINSAAEKYNAVENIGLGDTAMARLAQRAPSLGGMELASDLLTPISSRLGRINPALKFRVRKLEIETRRKTTERINQILPLMTATKKMSNKDRTVFDLALKNGDSEVISTIAGKYGITKEMDSARQMLDDVFKEAEGVGLEVSYREDFFPRQVKNPTAFSQYLRGRDDWGQIRIELEQKAEQLGKKFTDLTDEEIAGMTNNLLRGYGSQITLAKPGQFKARKIEELGTELNKFYEDSNTAMLNYVHKVTDEIEGRKFFGKAAGKDPVTTNPLTGERAVFNTDDSIGSYVTDLIAKGEITAKQQDEVTKILKARFKKGSMNGLVAAYRDLEYISTMGNPISALTQLGDLAFASFKNNPLRAARGVGKVLTGRNKMTKESLGIERIAQEFDNPAKTSKVLEKVFKMVGMEQVDRLGKEAFLEGSRLKLQKLASKNDVELVTDLNYMFDDIDAIKALEELKAGNVTIRTKEVHMNRLLDIQPLAKSEMPVKYLEMPDGRVFYMLKSFTIKQFDIFRREAVDKILFGNPREKVTGMKNLIYLSGTFMLANATADEIKDFILGRETSLKDRTVDNIYRLFGASKFDVYNSRERGLGFAVLQRILPPASVFDRLSTDVSRLAGDKRYKTGPLEGERYGSEAVQTIPGGGKLYYWWLGRGAQKEEYTTDDSSEAQNGRVRTISRPGAGEADSNARVRTIERP